jgi:hydroxymethylglutaryl-CoA lyase
MFENFPKQVNIVEVGPRDGLQNEKVNVSLKDKENYIKLLGKSGLKTIEVSSFVSPKAVPQMADASDLYKLISNSLEFKNINLPCLVPNVKGLELAIAAGVKEISLFTATSSEFTKKNINMTVDESFEVMAKIATVAKESNIKMRGYISTAFGCPYKGHMSKEELLDVSLRLLDLGVYEISIGDTIGVGTPKQVDEYLNFLIKDIDPNKIGMHFHDTRGMAIANILVSLKHGISTFDSSSGGLGGCPYAKGATGNVATEDLLYLFDSLNIKTGIELSSIVEASKYILNVIKKETPSKFLSAYLKQ